MYPFVTETYNPVGGICPFNCVYCWAKAIIKRYGHKKYGGSYYVVKDALKKKFKSGSFVFLCDMLDLFAPNVSAGIIHTVFRIIKNNPDSKFLLETKNPQRFFEFLDYFPDNVILGATIESDWDYPDVSKAPVQGVRMSYMMELSRRTELPLFISIEPILDFDLKWFISNIKTVKPWAVAVGYDNYNHKLQEPELRKTEKLIKELERVGIKVFRKTIKKAWWEK